VSSIAKISQNKMVLSWKLAIATCFICTHDGFEKQYAQPICQNFQVVKPLLEFKPWLQKKKKIIESDNNKIVSYT
jgi:hypothetical protein